MNRYQAQSRRSFLAAAAGLIPAVSLGAQSTDSKILSNVDDKADLALLQEMIRLKSYSGAGEEGAIATYMSEQMSTLGMQTRLIEVEPGRFDAVGVLPGTGGGTSLMLNGHLDTNPVGLGWTVDPFDGLIRDDMVYGIGVSNMKASCAAFFGAARAIVASGRRPRGDLILAFVVGELQGGIGTLELIQQGITADTFIVGEPTDLALLTLHAASLTIEVSTLGVTRHLSKREESVSALDTMLKVIDRIKNLSLTGSNREDYRSVQRINIGSMKAGLGREMHDWRPGQVPDFATIRMSVRYSPAQTEQSVLDDIRRELGALSAEDPAVRWEVSAAKKEGLPPPRAFEADNDSDIVRATRSSFEEIVGADAPIGAVAPYRYYGSDASHLQHLAGMRGVVCGAGGKYNTMPDERVELEQFYQATRLYARTAEKICAI